jgi:sulfite reductase (ferredoxin)
MREGFFYAKKMKSFRTEYENQTVERDILELEKKIYEFKTGKINEEKFRSLRLARGVYGQRQPGVQMVRIKLPYGKLMGKQLNHIAQLSDEYSNGNLHITTRQDIQIHYVSLDRTPELWSRLEEEDITLREACGNTVRNITASELAGIDPDEPFDVRPYAHAMFEHFLRNPIAQEMGRKVKISFSSSDKDTALSYIHDLGFIPKIRNGKKGFKVKVGGGLGSQSREADTLFEFLEAESILTLAEAIIRVFEFHGERNRRMKARLKFLVNELGFEEFKSLVLKELDLTRDIHLEIKESQKEDLSEGQPLPDISDQAFQKWLDSNLIKQKQTGLYAAGLKIQLGNISSIKARALATLASTYGNGEMTLTLRQNLIIRNVPGDKVYSLYNQLNQLGFGAIGFNSTSDITACPGTDTCNLGIASSTGLAFELERLLNEEYPELHSNKQIDIKISGCMNSCGQHMMSNIGFQGMSIKNKDGRVLPATQILLGGSNLENGKGRFGKKITKLPSKLVPQALRIILNDFLENDETDFIKYYDEKGERYFYDLLKFLSDKEVEEHFFTDWGNEQKYSKAVGLGECAGVVIDLVSTLLYDSEEKNEQAQLAIDEQRYSDAAYLIYQSLLNTAKALLVGEGIQSNSQKSVIENFEGQEQLRKFLNEGSLSELALRHKSLNQDSDELSDYLNISKAFLTKAFQTKSN